jgi:hypothetical protein
MSFNITSDNIVERKNYDDMAVHVMPFFEIYLLSKF